VKPYDFVIAGGGLAGLSLAYRLVNSPLRDRSILIIDKETKTRNDRTWAYWTDRPLPFESMVYRSWDRLHVVGDRFENVINLGSYRYKVIRGSDFYRHASETLSACGNVSFMRGVVRRIEDGADEARVTVDGGTVSGRWVFDSLYRPSQHQPDRDLYHHMKLHFRGWEIETPEPAFDPGAATLFDFRTAQGGETRFFYVLPFSRHRALVEYTVFSPAPLSRHAYEAALRDYVTGTLGIERHRIARQEGGCLPITDQPFPRRIGGRVMTIGVKGGRIKPSTGYAFVRVQQDSAAIARSLLQAGHPFDVPPDSRRYRLYNAMLLEIMEGQGEQIESIFAAMFKNNPIGRVLRFLDEGGSLRENLSLIATLPPRLFLQAMGRRKVRGALARPLLASLPVPGTLGEGLGTQLFRRGSLTEG
jgi:lycopene beta-cyclase